MATEIKLPNSRLPFGCILVLLGPPIFLAASHSQGPPTLVSLAAAVPGVCLMLVTSKIRHQAGATEIEKFVGFAGMYAAKGKILKVSGTRIWATPGARGVGVVYWAELKLDTGFGDRIPLASQNDSDPQVPQRVIEAVKEIGLPVELDKTIGTVGSQPIEEQFKALAQSLARDMPDSVDPS